MLLAFPDYAAQTSALATQARRAWTTIDVHRFPDGESRLRLPPQLPADVVLCRSLDRPNDKLVELLVAAATARELGAQRVTLVAPYLCYMRQDTRFSPGEAVSQPIIGQLLGERFDRIVTVDPHLHRITELRAVICRGEAVALSATAPIARFLQDHVANPLIVGPDGESEQWVAAIAALGGFDFVVGTKLRTGDRSVAIRLPTGACAGRDVVLVDDVASTGSTLARTAEECRAQGARSVAVVVTHGLFVGDALLQLRRAGIEQVWSTDSVAHPTNAIPLAPVLANAL